jgi:O-antigen ligase
MDMLKRIEKRIKNYVGYTLSPDTNRAEKNFAILNLSIPILMGILILVNPLPLSAVTEMCFLLSLAALMIILFYQKTGVTLYSPLTLPIILFFIWAAFGLFFTPDIKNTFHDLRAHLLEYIIIFYLLVNYFGSRKKLEIISWIIIISATIFCIGAIIDFYFIKGFPFQERMGVLTFSQMLTDYVGFVTVFAITLALNNLLKNKKVFYRILLLLCFLILCAATLITQSRGSIIGLFSSLILLSFNNKKIMLLVVLSVLIILLLPGLKERFNYESLVHNERNRINRLTIEVIKEHPLTGIGFGMQIYGNKDKDIVDLEKLNSRLPVQYQQKEIIVSPHNMLLDITARTGIIGAVLFLYILLAAFLMLGKILRATDDQYFKSWAICLLAGFVSFLIPSLFADTTLGPPVVVFYTILAMITILWNLSQKDNKVQ